MSNWASARRRLHEVVALDLHARSQFGGNAPAPVFRAEMARDEIGPAREQLLNRTALVASGARGLDHARTDVRAPDPVVERRVREPHRVGQHRDRIRFLARGRRGRPDLQGLARMVGAPLRQEALAEIRPDARRAEERGLVGRDEIDEMGELGRLRFDPPQVVRIGRERETAHARAAGAPGAGCACVRSSRCPCVRGSWRAICAGRRRRARPRPRRRSAVLDRVPSLRPRNVRPSC